MSGRVGAGDATGTGRSRLAYLTLLGVLIAGIAVWVSPAARADTVSATIAGPAGGTTGNPIAVSPDGSTVYTANSVANTVSVISASTNTVTATIPAAAAPTSLVVSPDGTRLYVSLFSTDSVLVINTATDATVATIPVGDGPAGIAITPDGSRVYTANVNGVVGSANESVIDTATNTVVASVSEAGPPRTVTVSPDGTRLYVGHFSPGSHNLTVINTATNAVTATIVTGVAANAVYGLAFSPDGTRLYGATRGANTLTVIDPTTNAIIGSIPVGTAPTSVAVTPDGTRAYVTNSTANTVSVINLATDAVVDTIAVGTGPSSIVIAPGGRYAYVTNVTAQTVSVLALDTFPAITTATLPAGTDGTAYTATIAATGSPAPQVTVTSGALPAGLTLNPTTGALTGIPTAPGSYTFTITAASTVSGIAATATRAYTITIAAAPVAGPTGGSGEAQLPATGVDVLPACMLSASLLLLGLALEVGSRQRTRRQGGRSANNSPTSHR